MKCYDNKFTIRIRSIFSNKNKVSQHGYSPKSLKNLILSIIFIYLFAVAMLRTQHVLNIFTTYYHLRNSMLAIHSTWDELIELMHLRFIAKRSYAGTCRLFRTFVGTYQ